MNVTLAPLPPLADLELMWRGLEGRASGSFFNSWSWIRAWLTAYGGAARAQSRMGLIIVSRKGSLVGLGVICRFLERRFPLGTKRVVLLHQTGEAADDAAFTEYNGLLCDETCAQETQAAFLDFISHAPEFQREPWCWDEFRIAGAGVAAVDAVRSAGLPYRSYRESACPWVDLRALSPGIDGYLAALSANTRSQIRRAMRLSQKNGALHVSVASSKQQAVNLLQEMQHLHEETWRRRGRGRGAFSHSDFEKFCTALIEYGHAQGSVELLRVQAGDKTVGILLNFIHGEQVYAYQSGLAYEDDNRSKPGLVTHALAIAAYQSRGLAGYHFMAGDSRYKSSLGTVSESQTWLTLGRNDARWRLAGLLRKLRAHWLKTDDLSTTFAGAPPP